MGCFRTCFGHCSNRHSKIKRLNNNGTKVLDQKIEEAQIEDPLKIDAEIENTNEEQLYRKKVTFDSNVNTHEDSEKTQSPKCENTLGEGENEAKVLSDMISSDSSQSSLFSYPLNNRYKNCPPSDDESDEIVSNSKNKGVQDGTMMQEETSDSLFSLSIDSRKQKQSEIGDKEVSSPFKPPPHQKISRNNVDSVLNPIENLSQWKKIVRTKSISSSKNSEEFTIGKENLAVPFSSQEKEEPTLKESKRITKKVAVETSLSSWLNNESEKKEKSPDSVGNSSSSKRMKSPKSLENRPILGALTLDEIIKEISRSSSPRQSSPSFSPDEKPITGGLLLEAAD